MGGSPTVSSSTTRPATRRRPIPPERPRALVPGLRNVMSFQTHCPGCRRELTVPETLRGKMVRCPKCQVTFPAEDAPDTEEDPIVFARRRTPKYEEPAYEEPEPGPEEEEYDERPRRRKRGGGRRARAREAVAGPAIALMAVGLLSVF